mgnify:CR=1 FL=1
MPEISASLVKELREQTGAGMMDAKRALVDANGDAEAAAQALREKGLAKAAARSDRDSSEGAIGLAVVEGRAALVHLRCETDFSAKSDQFVALADELASAVLEAGEGAVEANAAAIDEIRLSIKENVEVGEVTLIEATDGNLIDTYVHRQDGRGVNGVIIEATGVDQETLHQVALHIAFAKPTALSRDEIPSAIVDQERTALLDITKAEGKPEQAWDKIVEGRLGAWFSEKVLLEQGLHGEKTSVEQTLGEGRIVRFVQAHIGD